MKRFITAVFAPVLIAGLPSLAAADDYFPGKWAFDRAEACGQADGEFMLFDADGSFRIQKSATARTVGYWTPKAEVLTMEILSAPSSDKRRLWTYETIFSQDTVTVEPRCALPAG